MTTARLERIAMAHLQRHSSSTSNLRRVLRRRISKSCEEHEQDVAEFDTPLEELLEKLERLGYLDDRRYAASIARSARARGASRREIRSKLHQKGLAAGLVDALLAEESGDDVEAESAWRYARRRRLGPYREDPDHRRDQRQRDLAALGRRGFGYGIASQVVDADVEDIPDLFSQ